MFKHLVDKPSAQTVSDIIRNAVEIEQVMHTCTDWPPLAVFSSVKRHASNRYICRSKKWQNISVFSQCGAHI